MISLPDLVLTHAVDARRALAGRALVFSVLSPVGSFAGRGALRVLRARALDENGPVELTCGYESYERLEW